MDSIWKVRPMMRGVPKSAMESTNVSIAAAETAGASKRQRDLDEAPCRRQAQALARFLQRRVDRAEPGGGQQEDVGKNFRLNTAITPAAP